MAWLVSLEPAEFVTGRVDDNFSFWNVSKYYFEKNNFISNWSVPMSNPEEIKRYKSTNQIEYFKKRIFPALHKEGAAHQRRARELPAP